MKKIHELKNAAKPVGPYNPVVGATGELIFVSGQIGQDPATGKLAGPDVESQARQVVENIQNILSELGLDAGNIVKTTIFLADLSHFAEVNEIYATLFSGTDDYPARSTVGVSQLPLGALVEIELVLSK